MLLIQVIVSGNLMSQSKHKLLGQFSSTRLGWADKLTIDSVPYHVAYNLQFTPDAVGLVKSD
jgi:hypothetical protein